MTPQPSQIHLVVADDHPLMRMGLVALIETDTGLTVDAEATNGQEAIEAFRRHRPQVVLMDLRMPVLGGVEATAAIAREFPGAGILVLTTYDGDEDIYRALRAGARGYVLKNVPATQLLGAIRAVAAGRRYIPPEVAERLAERIAREEPTPREMEVLALLIHGKTNKEISAALKISEETTKTHVSNLLQKLGVADRTEAATTALLRGLIRPEGI